MDVTIYPKLLNGTVQAIPSKSHMHRLLICAAFSDKPTMLYCPASNQDIDATAGCLNALGAQITRTNDGYYVLPVAQVPSYAELDCKESGSTLRFLLPVAGSLGVDTTFLLSGRLPDRPLSPLWDEMERMGCRLNRPTKNTVQCRGRLHSGSYVIDGSVSSQYISGLLFAMSILPGESKLTITGKLESKPYVDMTLNALKIFGVEMVDQNITGRLPLSSPAAVSAEGDWSNAAFFLSANALGSHICVEGLDPLSAQGDRTVCTLLPQLSDFIQIDAANIPDLVPILAVAAGAKSGAVFHNINRLRLKESDRVATVAQMLTALGADVEVQQNTLTVYPAKYHGCTIDAHGDHRIAMAAAIAATVASEPVTILGAHCVSKSYPDFWSEYESLGGNYVQHIR